MIDYRDDYVNRIVYQCRFCRQDHTTKVPPETVHYFIRRDHVLDMHHGLWRIIPQKPHFMVCPDCLKKGVLTNVH